MNILRLISAFMIVIASSLSLAEQPAQSDAKPTFAKNPVATIKTSVGDIKIELLADKAPITVKNFIDYAESNFYNGTIFHRVIPDFMIQGGGMDMTLARKQTKEPIKNEANNGVPNNRGTIAMARTSKVDSATSQFFINTKNNKMLNHGERDFGYAVFGFVLDGMAIVDQISFAETEARLNGMMRDVPVKPIFIDKIEIAYPK